MCIRDRVCTVQRKIVHTLRRFSESTDFLHGQRPKTGIPCPFGVKIRYILKSSKKRTPRALPLVYNALYLFLPDEAQRGTPELSTLLDFNRVWSFFSQSAISIVPPHASYECIRMPTYGETPSTLRIPHHAIPATCCTCSLLRGSRAKLRQRRVDGAYLDFGCS